MDLALDPLARVLNRKFHVEGKYRIGETAERLRRSRQTIWGWSTGQWPVPVIGWRELYALTGDMDIAEAGTTGMNLTIARRLPIIPREGLTIVAESLNHLRHLMAILSKADRGEPLSDEEYALMYTILHEGKELWAELEEKIRRVPPPHS